MSRERRRRRDIRNEAGTVHVLAVARLVAEKEHFRYTTLREFFDYVASLFKRGVLVDRGPHPSGCGRTCSFDFDRMAPGSDWVTLKDLGLE